MPDDYAEDKFRDYLKRIQDPKDDRCWFCNKTPDQIRQEYYTYMEHPNEEFEDVELDELLIMTYKTKKPICAACYFAIKRNPDLINEILDTPEQELW